MSKQTSVARRGFLAAAGGAAAAVFVRGAQPVAASSGGGDQGPLILGSNDRFIAPNTPSNTANVSSVATVIKASPNFSFYAPSAGYFVFRADATPSNTDVNGLEGIGSGDGYGVYGHAVSGKGIMGEGVVGVSGSGATRGIEAYSNFGDGIVAYSTSGHGIYAASSQSVGGTFAGGSAAIKLFPSSAVGAPATGAHDAGELVVDSDGSLHLCQVGGTPGTWVSLMPAPAPVVPVFRTLPTPERFVDTRNGLGGLQGPVARGTTHTFQMTGRNGESADAMLQIPDTATILVGNLSVIGGPSIPVGSFVTMWPAGPRPTTSSISVGPGGIVANSFTVGLAPVTGHGYIEVFNLEQCDYIIDVVGFFEPSVAF